MRRWLPLCLGTAAGLAAAIGAADDPPPESTREATSEESTAEFAVTKEGEPIDPTGRFSDDLIDDTPRYFLWHDQSGWHVRTTSSRGTFSRYDGTIRVTDGTFARLRPIGLERRGQNPDKWELNDERDEMTFEIATNSSFDGFDFTIDGTDAALRFDLNISKKGYRNRIIIGRDGVSPSEKTFNFPAAP
jgi:hypothetical protein